MGAVISTDDLLDFGPLVGGQRGEDYEFDLLDQAHNVVGSLDVDLTAPPTVTFDGSRSTPRTCTGLKVNKSTLADIDTRRERVRPVQRLENNDRKSLGVFMFGTDVRAPQGGGVLWTPDLFDESFLLTQALDRNVGLQPGGSVLGLLAQLVGEVGITQIVSEVADQPAGSALTYAVGSLRSDAANALAQLLGGYPPFLDSNGALYLKAIPSAGSGPDHIFEPGGRVINDSLKVTNTNYKAANEYVVVSGSSSAPVVGIYYLPDAAPNSVAQTGETIVKNMPPVQGLSQSAANDVAKAYAITDTSNYLQASWSSIADARHGGYDLCQVYGQLYVEQSWSIVCFAGQPMTHAGNGFFG